MSLGESIDQHVNSFIKYKIFILFDIVLDDAGSGTALTKPPSSKQSNPRSAQRSGVVERRSGRSAAGSSSSTVRKRCLPGKLDTSDSITSTSSSSMHTENDSDNEDDDDDTNHASPSLPKIRKTDAATCTAIGRQSTTAYAISAALLQKDSVSEIQTAWSCIESDDEAAVLPPPVTRSTRSMKERHRKQSQLPKNAALPGAASVDGHRVSSLLTLYSTPFKICIVQNFLDDATHIGELIKEMSTIEWQRKQMDLYEFHQTTDLANLTPRNGPALRSFHRTLNDTMLPWMQQISGLNLTHVSASCSMYNYGDFLLAHDDLLTDRQIAFVFYLTPWPDADNWTNSMGGALELFDCENGRPKYPVTRAFLPRNNQFVFFRVCSKSFHQVGEVTNVVYPRLTINGWFHGPPSINESADHSGVSEADTVEAVSPYISPVVDEFELSEWINGIYLEQRAIVNIHQHIEDNSEASLEKFLIQDFYDLLVTEFCDNKDLEWVLEGPASQRKYETLRFTAQSTGPPKDLHSLFTSKSMFTLLHQYTELDFDGPKMKSPTCSVQICRFTQGCYTLLGDSSTFAESALDVILFFNTKNQVGTVTYLCPNILARACVGNESDLAHGDGNTNTSSEWNQLTAEASASTTMANTSGRCRTTAKRTKPRTVDTIARARKNRRNGRNTSSNEDAEVMAIMSPNITTSSVGANSSSEAVMIDGKDTDDDDDLANADDDGDDDDGDDDDDDEEDDDDAQEGDYGDMGPEGVLLTVHPKNNALNLVYRLDGQARFVKYASKSSIADDEYVYILFATFKE